MICQRLKLQGTSKKFIGSKKFQQNGSSKKESATLVLLCQRLKLRGTSKKITDSKKIIQNVSSKKMRAILALQCQRLKLRNTSLIYLLTVSGIISV
jgi:ABC-type transport system involved in Fe-S cluster assembly fused permease/ATPase subunit